MSDDLKRAAAGYLEAVRALTAAQRALDRQREAVLACAGEFSGSVPAGKGFVVKVEPVEGRVSWERWG